MHDSSSWDGMLNYIGRQRMWSQSTFGGGPRTGGVIQHIRKELCEIEADPSDIEEWIDVVILALDGAWRAGYSPAKIVAALVEKQEVNRNRQWPAPGPQDQANEHIR